MSIKSFISNLWGKPKYHCFIHEALTWGHSISIDKVVDDGLTHHIVGHSSRHINRGDYIVLGSIKDKRVARYRVKKIFYFYDPGDMFKATAVYKKQATPSDRQMVERCLEESNKGLSLCQTKNYQPTESTISSSSAI